MRQTDPKQPPNQVEPGGERRNPASCHSSKPFSRCVGVQIESLFNELLVLRHLLARWSPQETALEGTVRIPLSIRLPQGARERFPVAAAHGLPRRYLRPAPPPTHRHDRALVMPRSSRAVLNWARAPRRRPAGSTTPARTTTVHNSSAARSLACGPRRDKRARPRFAASQASSHGPAVPFFKTVLQVSDPMLLRIQLFRGTARRIKWLAEIVLSA